MSFWCLLKLTNWRHYGKKIEMREKAQGALHNFLAKVARPDCWDTGVVFSVGEKQPQILY